MRCVRVALFPGYTLIGLSASAWVKPGNEASARPHKANSLFLVLSHKKVSRPLSFFFVWPN